MRYLLILLLLSLYTPPQVHAYPDAYANAVIVAYELGKPSLASGYARWVYEYKDLRVTYAENGNYAYAIVRCHAVTVGNWTAQRVKGGWAVQERRYWASACWGLLARIADVVRA